MSVVGYSTLEVIPSVKNLRSQIESQTSKDFASAGKRGGQQFGDAAGVSAGGAFKSRFGSLAKDVAAPVAGIFAGAAVVDLFKNAIAGASDLAESGNKVQVIFGDATDQVTAFADQGAKALGQTKLEVLNAASSFGTFGKAAGLTGSELAGFSTKLAGLSTDLASFFNTDPAQAAEAIAAGLRGESEPLRQFGVLLDDATLRQEAMRQGLIATTKTALTPQQKVLAAYQVILKQTKDAQGDFGRTSGGLANQQRILTAQWKEMETGLGTRLLPAATSTVKVFNNGLLPALDSTGRSVGTAVHAFEEIPGPVKAAIGAYVALRAASALAAAAQVRLAGAFAAARTGALASSVSVGALAKSAGRLAVLVGAFEALNALKPDDAAIARYAETLDAVAGPKIPDQIKATTAEIQKQQKIIDDAFGPTFHLFGSTVTPFEFGNDWKTADEKVRVLKEHLADLKHQQELGNIASKQSTAQMQTYASRLNSAEKSVRGLLDAENRRRNFNLSAFRDQTALAQAIADARKEAADGARTLDINTEAGRKNRDALSALADQWNNSASTIRNTRGLYDKTRRQFIDIADSMGLSTQKARELADRLLSVPKNTPAKITTPGMEAALAKLKALNAEMSALRKGARIVVAAQGAKNRADLADLRSTPGATSSRLGRSQAGPTLSSLTNNQTFNFNGDIVAQDPLALLQEMQRRARRAAADGVQR